MASVRFPATGREVNLAQLADGGAVIPTQVYIVLLNDNATATEDSAALLARFVAEFGEWADHRSMFGGKMISGTLNQAQVTWLLRNDGGSIKLIEADGQVGFGDEVSAGGSPNFIMVDDERVQLNVDALAALAAASSPYEQIETLAALQVCPSRLRTLVT